MLLPISHEKMSTRRLPLVTVVLVFLNVLVHGLVMTWTPDAERRVVSAVVEADMLRREDPSLGMCAPLEPFGTSRLDGEGDMTGKLDALRGSLDALESLAGAKSERPPEDRAREERRRKYDAACDSLASAVDELPARRFGFVPAKKNVVGLLTSIFVHGSIPHLVGNMWFLFLAGFALEDRWGRLPFLGFYLVAGIVAALAHWVMNVGSTVPIVGASGAVAGAMGTFLVLYATTRIRFVALVGRPIFFHAPAYVMLPLWVGVEAVFGFVGREAGTAHWAHVGGFAFGVAVALAFRFAGVDRKLDDAVERVAVLGDDPRVDAARELVAKGDAPTALAMLQGLAREKPESVHVWQALFDAANAVGDPAAIAEAARALEALSVRRSDPTAPLPEPPRASDPSARRLPSPSLAGRPTPEESPPRSFRAAPKTTSSAAQPVAPRVASAPEPEAAPYFPVPPPRK